MPLPGSDGTRRERRAGSSSSFTASAVVVIRESGLLRRRCAGYWTRIGLTVGAFVAVWAGDRMGTSRRHPVARVPAAAYEQDR